MGERVMVTDAEKLTLLYERFRDVCLVEKEVWKEIFMPRDITLGGPVWTNIQDRYDTWAAAATVSQLVTLSGRGNFRNRVENKPLLTFIGLLMAFLPCCT